MGLHPELSAATKPDVHQTGICTLYSDSFSIRIRIIVLTATGSYVLAHTTEAILPLLTL